MYWRGLWFRAPRLVRQSRGIGERDLRRSQTLPGASFIVNGALPVKDSPLVSAGGELRIANGVTMLAKFDGEFAGRSNTYAGTGTLRYRW